MAWFDGYDHIIYTLTPQRKPREWGRLGSVKYKDLDEKPKKRLSK